MTGLLPFPGLGSPDLWREVHRQRSRDLWSWDAARPANWEEYTSASFFLFDVSG